MHPVIDVAYLTPTAINGTATPAPLLSRLIAPPIHFALFLFSIRSHTSGTSLLGGTATSKRGLSREGKLADVPLAVELIPVGHQREAEMEPMTRASEPVEKPGRLMLAIAEWQRLLVARRESLVDRSIIEALGEDGCDA